MSFTSRRRLILPALVTIAIASLLLRPYITSRTLAQPRRTGGSTSTRNAASTLVPVAVTKVSKADLPIKLSALGSVAAFNTVTVRPRVDGQLTRVAFREGQFVKQGDLLAEIDSRPFQVQLEQAEGQFGKDQAQLSNARVDLTRYQTLWSEDSIAQQNVTAQESTVKQLEAGLKVDQSAIDSARLNLTYSRITAPISMDCVSGPNATRQSRRSRVMPTASANPTAMPTGSQTATLWLAAPTAAPIPAPNARPNPIEPDCNWFESCEGALMFVSA